MKMHDGSSDPGNTRQDCDILVIGAGPAGCTAAILLARKGWRVILLEKEYYPRHHIGESLLPMNLLVFERLGVLDQVKAMGVLKMAADFEGDDTRGHHAFLFDRALGGSPGHAYQVCRAEFDAMLLEHAVAEGVDARQGHKVLSVEHEGPRRASVQVRPDAGEAYRIEARYVIDASGRDALLSRRRQLLRRSRVHQSAAIFGRFRGARNRPAPEQGNISIYLFPHGWMWMIPQPDGEMSVGAVCQPAFLRAQRRGRSKRDFLMQTLRSQSALWSRLEQAELIDDKIYAAGNYTYTSTRLGGPGWLLIGDAFAFLDPVFSSGVFLAMSGAERAADLVDVALRDPRQEAALQRRLEKRLRKGMRRLGWVIYRFNSTAMRDLFMHPRNVLGIESAIISMLAGDVFDNPRVLPRLYMFRLLYFLHSLRRPRLAWREWRARIPPTEPVDP